MTRATPAGELTFTGGAVRTHGGEATVRILPGDAGFQVCRDDLGSRLTADLDHLVGVPNCTALGRDGRPEVLFVEHLLSALVGLGFTDAEIHVDNPEIPLLDGSALPFAQALARVGRTLLDGDIEPLRPAEPVIWEADGRRIEAHPAATWSVEYEFEHPHPLLGRDVAEFGADVDYGAAIAPARTFATAGELEALRAAGLIKGGSEDNLLVVYDDRLSAEPRLAHEFATHKILDLIGDLALLGRPLIARLVARRTGHADNHALGRMLR